MSGFLMTFLWRVKAFLRSHGMIWYLLMWTTWFLFLYIGLYTIDSMKTLTDAELHVLKVEPLSRLKELARVSYFCFISMYGLSKDHEFVSKALKKLCDLALIDLNILISMLMYVSSLCCSKNPLFKIFPNVWSLPNYF